MIAGTFSFFNPANPVVGAFMQLDDDKKKFVANQVYYMARLAYKKLSPEEMKEFADNNEELLKNYIGK